MIITGFDIETTGLSQPDGHRIVEIAALLYDSETQALKAKWVQRINPQRPIDPNAQAVHRISFEDVASCPTFDEVAPQLVRILKASTMVVAHNGDGFDRPFVEGELKRIGLEVPTPIWFDTMTNARWATPMGKLPKLKELCFACGVDYDDEKAHAAEFDVTVMMESFFAALNKGFFTQMEAA